MKNNIQIEQFGARLKELRKTAGLTQAALAYEAGIGIRTIYNLEKGQQAITIDVLISLAKALHATPAQMFEGVEIEYEE